MWVQSLRGEDPLEGGKTTHSSILTCAISWTEEPGGLYSPWGHTESDTTEATQHTDMCGIQKISTDEAICRDGIKMQTQKQRMGLWTQ